MIKFSKEKILLLHKILGEATGGSEGIREGSVTPRRENSSAEAFFEKES